MAQTLETIISINAKTGNGFSTVGNTLTQLGSLVNGISQQLIEFGTESVQVYRDYEKSMKDAEVALSTTYGRSTKELSSVMSQLDGYATEWAASSIFHTNDVANAISEAAHAGWNYEKIISGIPAAMQLAQAGGLDLSESVNYIVKSTNAAGISFEDMTDFIDLWTFAANSSASTVGEFGEAMLRMGSTMRFAGDTEELMTLIAVTANAGSVGSEAGTLIRNSILRLIAPTQKAGEVMAELGATSEETAELIDDQALAAANAELAARGFSAFDENGNLKNTLDIYRELYMALGDLAGGFDNIDKNESALQTLAAIFPTRTITEALTLLRSASEGYDGLYEAMKGGDATGYGQYAAETMMDTLDGKIETFGSKVERLKQLVGEELAPGLENALEFFGGIVDSIAELDEGTFGALVSGAEAIALAGPALLTAGAAFRFIGSAMSPAGAIGLSAIAIVAAANALQEMEKVDFENNFGSLELDATEINSYIGSISSGFNEANENINAFSTALGNAVSAYQTSSSELKGELITDLLTNATLTDAQIKSLNSLGEDMISSVQTGIENNYAAVMQSITNSFGGEDGAENIDNPVWAQIMSVMEQGFESELSRAEELGKQLRDAMTSAFSDGSLTSEEVSNIQSIIDQQNQLLAEQVDREHYLERQRILRQSQTLGLSAIQEATQAMTAERDAEWETLQDRQAGDYYDTENWYNKAIENGWMVPNTDGTTGEHVATEADKTYAMQQLSAAQETERLKWTAGYDDFIMQTWKEGIQSSDLSGTWNSLQTLADSFQQAGGIVTRNAADEFNNSVSGKDAEQTSQYLNMMVDALGGYEAISGYERYYSSLGNEYQASQYRDIMAMYEVLGNGNNVTAYAGATGNGNYNVEQGSREQMQNILSGYNDYMTPEFLSSYIGEQIGYGLQPDWSILGEDLQSVMMSTANASGYAGITEWVNAVEAENPQVNVEPVFDGDLPEMEPVPVPIEPHVEGEDSVSALQEQGVQVQVDGDTQQLQATIDGADGQNLMEYVSGDASQLEMSISDQNGRTLVEHITGDASSLGAAIAQYEGRTITVNIAGNRMFASGGRATTASIFGEAGPEWAIPEEHSQRTADLLNAAREASGFSWSELISNYGGLNAGTNAGNTTLVYSPVINAQDATGVEAVLMEDKKRFDKWFEEKKTLDEIEVYR